MSSTKTPLSDALRLSKAAIVKATGIAPTVVIMSDELYIELVDEIYLTNPSALMGNNDGERYHDIDTFDGMTVTRYPDETGVGFWIYDGAKYA